MALEDAPDEIDDEIDDEDAEAEPDDVAPPGGDGDGSDDASLEEILAEKSKKRKESEETDEDESVLSLDREDRVAGSLPGKVTPQQATEFVCRSCFLVKHQSQLANKKRMLCKDCA